MEMQPQHEWQNAQCCLNTGAATHAEKLSFPTVIKTIFRTGWIILTEKVPWQRYMLYITEAQKPLLQTTALFI